jgi:multisubunit Na+/H+ antiporter MnhB subunit
MNSGNLTDEELKTKIVCGMVVLATIPVSFLLRGYVASTVWAWHVAPLGAPPLGVIEACFALVVLRALISIPSRKLDGEDPIKGAGRAIGWGLAAPLIGLLVAWVML